MTKKIVIVDDEPEIAKMLAEFLTDAGYSAFYALSGPEGLALIKKETPDLVLLDIGMPGMDGLEVLAEIRSRAAEPAVIMLTANRESETVKRALELGAAEYITKPIHLETLLSHFIKPVIGLAK